MPLSKKTLDNKQRLDVLAEIENQEKSGKVNFTEIGKKFNISRKTVARISESRESLLENARSGNLSQKRKRHFKGEDVDEALFIWVKAKLQQNVRMNLPALKFKATELARELDHDFVPSDGWLDRFKERHGLKFKKENGGKQNLDPKAAETFRSQTLPHWLEQCEAKDIFNMSNDVVNEDLDLLHIKKEPLLNHGNLTQEEEESKDWTSQLQHEIKTEMSEDQRVSSQLDLSTRLVHESCEATIRPDIKNSEVMIQQTAVVQIETDTSDLDQDNIIPQSEVFETKTDLDHEKIHAQTLINEVERKIKAKAPNSQLLLHEMKTVKCDSCGQPLSTKKGTYPSRRKTI